MVEQREDIPHEDNPHVEKPLRDVVERRPQGADGEAQHNRPKEQPRPVPALLQAADCILCALDTDAAGGRAAWRFDPERFGWDVTYPQAIRWPVPACFGKDRADMVGKYSLTAWALAGLPGYIRDRAESSLLRSQGAAVPVAADAPDAAPAVDEEVF